MGDCDFEYEVEDLTLENPDIGLDGDRSSSIALMNENNKVTSLDLSNIMIGDEGVQSLSLALMNENNKVIKDTSSFYSFNACSSNKRSVPFKSINHPSVCAILISRSLDSIRK